MTCGDGCCACGRLLGGVPCDACDVLDGCARDAYAGGLDSCAVDGGVAVLVLVVVSLRFMFRGGVRVPACSRSSSNSRMTLVNACVPVSTCSSSFGGCATSGLTARN